MNEAIIILQILSLLGTMCIFIFRKYLLSYSSEKGKNLATKEDISEITTKIETVKHDYANQLESTKAELSAQLNTHSFRYEKEYEILSELTALLVSLRDASVSLRPAFDIKSPDKTEAEIKNERLQRFVEAQRDIYHAREKKRPFYPDEIYQSLVKIESIAHTESIKYAHQNPFENGNYLSYWEEAEKNQAEITSSAELAMKIIRERVTKWDILHKGL